MFARLGKHKHVCFHKISTHGTAHSIRSSTCVHTQAPELTLVPRGAIEVKGKGTMNTFWVTGPVPSLDSLKTVKTAAGTANGFSSSWRTASQLTTSKNSNGSNGGGGTANGCEGGKSRTGQGAVAAPIPTTSATLTFATLW